MNAYHKALDGKRGAFLSPTGRHKVVLCARHRSKYWPHNTALTTVLMVLPEFHPDRLCECCLGKLETARDALTGRRQPKKRKTKGKKR